jgi:hypothetical protein
MRAKRKKERAASVKVVRRKGMCRTSCCHLPRTSFCLTTGLLVLFTQNGGRSGKGGRRHVEECPHADRSIDRSRYI